MPPELGFALSVSLDGIRPWEYMAADAEQMHMINEVRAAWFEELKEEQRALHQDDSDQ